MSENHEEDGSSSEKSLKFIFSKRQFLHVSELFYLDTLSNQFTHSLLSLKDMFVFLEK